MSPQPQRERNSEGLSQRTRNLITWIFALVAVVLMTSVFGSMIVFYKNRPDILEEVARNHFRGIMGMPMAVMTALAIVTFLRVTSGNLEFKAFGFEFKGASGPVVLWVLTFLACVAGTIALW